MIRRLGAVGLCRVEIDLGRRSLRHDERLYRHEDAVGQRLQPSVAAVTRPAIARRTPDVIAVALPDARPARDTPWPPDPPASAAPAVAMRRTLPAKPTCAARRCP